MFHQKPYRTHYDYEKGRTIDMEWGGRLTDLPALSPFPLRIYRGTQSIIIRPKYQVDTYLARNPDFISKS